MADFDVSRFRTTSFMTIWDLLKEVLVNMVKWFDGTTDTNLPVGTKRWSSSNKRFEQWDGSTWGELLPVADSASAYQIRVAMANECSGNAATADLADNSLSLGGVLAAQFVQTTDARLSNSRQCNNAFDNAGTARTNLDVYSKSETGTVISSAISSKANTDSPALTGTPTAPTAAAGAYNAQIATTAFVSRLLTNRIYVGTYSGAYAISESGNTGRSRVVATLAFTPLVVLFFAGDLFCHADASGSNSYSTPSIDARISGGNITVYGVYVSAGDVTVNILNASGKTYTFLAIG